jgi:hypothetical protein
MTVPHIVTDTSEPSKRTLANRRNALKSTGPRTARSPHRANALNHYKSAAVAAAAAEGEPIGEEVPEPAHPEENTTPYRMALNWQDDPVPPFYPSQPSRESMNRNQALREFAASIGQPLPVFTERDAEDNR